MTELMVLAVTIPLAVLVTALALFLTMRRQEQHLIMVLDRFLSRNMSEYAMTDVARRELTIDQEALVDEDAREEEEFEKYLQSRQTVVEVLGDQLESSRR